MVRCCVSECNSKCLWGFRGGVAFFLVTVAVDYCVLGIKVLHLGDFAVAFSGCCTLVLRLCFVT